jgi:hypothetical protein
MAAVLLDATVLIDLPRGRRGGVARLEGLHSAGDRPHSSAINVEVIERGLRGDREAAAALVIGGRLATGNPADFPMSELEVEHWPVGE